MLQIEETHEPRAARSNRVRATPRARVRAARSDTPPPPKATRPQRPRRPASADTDRGLSLLFSFVGAASIMVADVVVMGAVEQSWVLIPGFAVLLLTTAIVFVGIMRLLADDGKDTTPDAR